MKYSIVIPAYNEAARISPTLEKVLAHASQQGWPAEIIVVNDGSRDNTAEIVRDWARRNPAVKLVENPGNRGKGYSVRNGMLHAQGDVLLFSDADLSSPIYEAGKLFAALENGDFTVGPVSRLIDSTRNRYSAAVVELDSSWARMSSVKVLFGRLDAVI